MAILKYKDSNGNYQALANYTVQPITPVQETGTSTTDIMSQNAVTNALATKANTSDVYSKTDIQNNYLSKSDATSTYLTKNEASNTYQTTQQVKNIVNQTVYGTETPSTEQTNASVVTTENLTETLVGYQEKLTAGDGISINDNKISCTVDLSLFKVVDKLPTSDIDATKIYLVKSATEGTLDVYTEYMYVNGQWETFGTFKTDVDLSGYLKSDVAASTYLTKNDAADTYLSKTSASSTYQTKGDYALKSDVPTNNNQLDNGAGYQTSANVSTSINNALADYTTTATLETNYAKKSTTIAGYGITDAKISNGVITLGNATITPLTAIPADYVTETELTAKGYATTAQLDSKSDSDHTHALSEFGIDATAAELNYCDGVTSNIQTQLGTKANASDLTSHTSNTTVHITSAERTTWNAKASTSVATTSADGLMSSTDKTNLNALVNFYEGRNTATSIASIPVSKRLCVATISANGSFSLASVPTAGREIHVIVKNSSTSDITITLPNSGNYVTMDSEATSLTVKGSGYADINAISDGSKVYIRAL